MATALVSALTRRPVKRGVALTGEITLRGRVLPIGGVREKVLAAYRAGLKTVLLPKRNEKDLVEVPRRVQRSLRFVLVECMDDVLPVALLADPLPPEAPAEKPKPRRRSVAAKNRRSVEEHGPQAPSA